MPGGRCSSGTERGLAIPADRERSWIGLSALRAGLLLGGGVVRGFKELTDETDRTINVGVLDDTQRRSELRNGDRRSRQMFVAQKRSDSLRLDEALKMADGGAVTASKYFDHGMSGVGRRSGVWRLSNLQRPRYRKSVEVFSSGTTTAQESDLAQRGEHHSIRLPLSFHNRGVIRAG